MPGVQLKRLHNHPRLTIGRAYKAIILSADPAGGSGLLSPLTWISAESGGVMDVGLFGRKLQPNLSE